MPYYITKTNGDELVTIEDGTVNSTATDLTLLGKNYPTYGLSLNQNFIKLLENFAGVDQPSYPLNGQLWYDTASKSLNFYREGNLTDGWKNLSVIHKSEQEPTEVLQGDIWFDLATNQLKIFDGGSWITVGPQTTSTGLLRITGNNSFILQIGGIDVFTVYPGGIVSKPFNPVLQAFNHTGSTNFSTSSIITYNVWIPLSISFDNSASFNIANGVYTCVANGYYRVTFSGTTLASGAHSLKWQLNPGTGFADTGISGYNSHTDGQQNIICTGIIEAEAGDTIRLVGSTDSGASISYQNASYSIEFIG